MSKSVLVVDDNASWRNLCLEIVRGLRLETHLADTGGGALDVLEHHPVDIVLADVRGPGLSGIELLKTIKQKYPETDVVMMADSGTIPGRWRASAQALTTTSPTSANRSKPMTSNTCSNACWKSGI